MMREEWLGGGQRFGIPLMPGFLHPPLADTSLPADLHAESISSAAANMAAGAVSGVRCTRPGSASRCADELPKHRVGKAAEHADPHFRLLLSAQVASAVGSALTSAGDANAGTAVTATGAGVADVTSAVTSAAACWGSISAGFAAGGSIPIIGPITALLGAAAGAYVSKDSCMNALNKTGATINDMTTAASAAAAAVMCPGASFPVSTAQACADACTAQAAGCQGQIYLDSGCCQCTVDCSTAPTTASSTASSIASSTSPSSSPSSSYATSDPVCGALQTDTDFWGGDIPSGVPGGACSSSGSAWSYKAAAGYNCCVTRPNAPPLPHAGTHPDTVVAASTPSSCCAACELYPFCHAWTWTNSKECSDRLPGTPGTRRGGQGCERALPHQLGQLHRANARAAQRARLRPVCYTRRRQPPASSPGHE